MTDAHRSDRPGPPDPAVPNATAAALLGLLHEGPRTGWELVGRVDQRLGDFWSVTRSQVYRELNGMARSGLVEAGETGARDARPFAITDDGRRAFAEWLASDPAPETVRVPLLLTIAFSEHMETGRLREILARQRAEHAARLERYLAGRAAIAADPAGDRTRLATVAFGVGYERSVLAWFDELEGILDADS